MFSTFINIIAAPKLAYEQLQVKPSILPPLILLLAVVAASTFIYFHLSDPELLIDDMVEQAGADMSEPERKEARASMESLGVDSLKWITSIGGAVSTLVMFVIQAGYLFLVSMFAGTKIGFKHWMSFSTWSSLPLLFAIIAGFATAILNTAHIPLTQINPLTLTNLLGFESSNTSLVRLMDSIDLTRLWTIGLMLFGYRIWTRKSWLHCSAVVLLPFIAIYGIWLARVL